MVPGVNLIPRVYETEKTDPLALSDELMEQLRYVPKDLECQTALGDKAVFRESRLDAGVLSLYFDVSYVNMKPEQEILCRAALARTLTQIPGVDLYQYLLWRSAADGWSGKSGRRCVCLRILY